jgi:polar amino acid transport system permease protein
MSPRTQRPWWLVVLLVGLAAVLLGVANDAGMRETLWVLRRGLLVTVRVTIFGFALALSLGVLAGLGRVSERAWARQPATLYVEVVRGVPMLVLVLWFGFAFAPWIVGLGREALLGPLEALLDAGWRLGGLLPSLATKVDACSRPSECLPMEARGIVGLGVGYGAYIAEIVRAGIESVGAGQHEAAASLGMSRRQAMRHVVLPQAMRLALPPLGNDLVALLKDSSLISILAVPDLVHVARVHVSRTFEALETWNLVALLYLMLTLSLSAGVRWLERRGSWVQGEGSD